MNTKRQFLITIRIDAENSEDMDYFMHGEDQLDFNTVKYHNHEVVEHSEIIIKETNPRVLLERAVDNLCLISCKKCGHYNMKNWTCPECGHDNSL